MDNESYSDSSDENNTITETRNEPSSPNVITSEPIPSVSNFVVSLEAKNKTSPTEGLEKDKKSRSRPKTTVNSSDVSKTKTKK